MMDKETKLLYEHTKVQPPQTYQYRMLKFQEGMVATALVCGIVLFELLYISELPNETEFSTNFFAGLAVSGFFLLEILLRFYNWWHTFLSSSASEAYTSGAKARKKPAVVFQVAVSIYGRDPSAYRRLDPHSDAHSRRCVALRIRASCCSSIEGLSSLKFYFVDCVPVFNAHSPLTCLLLTFFLFLCKSQ
jgi:hypothetical protein